LQQTQTILYSLLPVASVAQLVEQLTLNQLVLGSSPSRGTSFTEENGESTKPDTDLAQKPAESEPRKVKFPQVIRHQKAEVTIYGKSRQSTGLLRRFAI
jgi:hypothetical protein